MENVSCKWAWGSLGPCTEWHRTRQTPCHRNKKHPLPSTPETKHCQLRALMLRQHDFQNHFCQLLLCLVMAHGNLCLCPVKLFVRNFASMHKLGKMLMYNMLQFFFVHIKGLPKGLSVMHEILNNNLKMICVILCFTESWSINKNYVFHGARLKITRCLELESVL